MTRLSMVHLLDDVAQGGVTQALAVFTLPGLAENLETRTLQVDPDRDRAPALDADIIVTHFPPRWRALPYLQALKSRNPRARLVHIEHSYTGCWEALYVPRRLRFRCMLRLVYRLFDRVVAVSHGQAEWLDRVARPGARRLTVIPPLSVVPGIDSLAAPGWSGQRPLVVGSYGRFSEQKGFDRLVTLFRGLPPTRYQLLLGGFGEQEEWLHALAEGVPQVNFCGEVTDRLDFLARCDVIVVPSRYEAYGLVATEARQAGRPIMVADVDGLPEQTCAGRAGMIVDFQSPDGLRDALEALTPALLHSLRMGARHSVQGLQQERVLAWRRFLGMEKTMACRL
ncbi:glycosyltransferase family 4 protein [Modicisalibacter radicis]|uniref:glycosyltransferase family 4 protein n=1 Tax=Halomonas sp. EAR18 TaxID=2518972 RepID=UPI00109C3221|nr:glycosyltransferase family 4 protein [Halomonas sp. EAR18]